MKATIGIIGFGNMGSGLGGQLKSKYQIWAFDKDKNKTHNLIEINIADNIQDLVTQGDAIILAVKPQDFDTLLKEIKNDTEGKLVISIAAGINTKFIERVLVDTRVIRAMPNIGAKIGESVTCLCKGTLAGDDDLLFAQELFNYLGRTKQIKEKMMNAATAISGSGPAYVCEYIESQSIDPDNIPEQKKRIFLDDFQKAAKGIGFNQEEATFLVNNTFTSTIDILKKTNFSPSELKKQVASKGGTTEAALEVLHRRGSLEEAVKEALKRAEGLSGTLYTS